jgi:hypothetical protein
MRDISFTKRHAFAAIAIICAVCGDIRAETTLGTGDVREVTDVIRASATGRLFSLEPTMHRVAGPGTLDGFKVVGAIDLEPQQFARARDAFLSSLATPSDRYGVCFKPRHALRLVLNGQIYDILLCYECKRAQAFRNGRLVGIFPADGSPGALNDLLRSLKIALSPI